MLQWFFSNVSPGQANDEMKRDIVKVVGEFLSLIFLKGTSSKILILVTLLFFKYLLISSIHNFECWKPTETLPLIVVLVYCGGPPGELRKAEGGADRFGHNCTLQMGKFSVASASNLRCQGGAMDIPPRALRTRLFLGLTARTSADSISLIFMALGHCDDGWHMRTTGHKPRSVSFGVCPINAPRA
ncbi:hypothetical protein ARMGADRAFT_1034574 [Armillaria gallica]|uniref:Uncharacterized protein n=1 Tax=Armillaria gallica TaxID=47427 RepID=A0A2H3DHB8_ARMGA|nr:hypothetical protein ARMGADRAFT_1034574 [Armillaria gallica]